MKAVRWTEFVSTLSELFKKFGFILVDAEYDLLDQDSSECRDVAVYCYFEKDGRVHFEMFLGEVRLSAKGVVVDDEGPLFTHLALIDYNFNKLFVADVGDEEELRKLVEKSSPDVARGDFLEMFRQRVEEAAVDEVSELSRTLREAGFDAVVSIQTRWDSVGLDISLSGLGTRLFFFPIFGHDVNGVAPGIYIEANALTVEEIAYILQLGAKAVERIGERVK